MTKGWITWLGGAAAIGAATLAGAQDKPAPKPAAKAALAKPSPAKPIPGKPAPAKPTPASAAAAKPAAAGAPAPAKPAPAAAALAPGAAAPAPTAAPSAPIAFPGTAAYAPDLDILHAQVILDRLGFAPGVIDGRAGRSLALAISGYQAANGLNVSGKLDPKTLAALAEHKDIRPLAVVTLSPADLAGQFVGPLPHDYALQSKLPCLCYADAAEMLAERYHSSAAALAALNPGVKLVPGAQIKVPDVTDGNRAYPTNLKPEWTATLAGLNVPADVPKAAKVVVRKGAGSLSVYDAAGKLVAQFPVTTGSSHDPLPIGEWKIQGVATNPPFHFNPSLFWDAKKGDEKALLPPGPNGPVGIVWIDLSKPHYGIHGTPNPEKIGRSESHGCIRLSNWDAGRLALMVHAGVPAVFEE